MFWSDDDDNDNGTVVVVVAVVTAFSLLLSRAFAAFAGSCLLRLNSFALNCMFGVLFSSIIGLVFEVAGDFRIFFAAVTIIGPRLSAANIRRARLNEWAQLGGFGLAAGTDAVADSLGGVDCFGRLTARDEFELAHPPPLLASDELDAAKSRQHLPAAVALKFCHCLLLLANLPVAGAASAETARRLWELIVVGAGLATLSTRITLAPADSQALCC